MRKLIVGLLVIWTGGCGTVATLPEFEETKIYDYQLDQEQKYYFEFPASAQVLEASDYVSFGLGQGCEVVVKNDDDFVDQNLVERSTNDAGILYRAFFDQSDNLVRYSAEVEEPGVVFFVKGEEISGCVAALEKMAGSFGDKQIYINDKYDFKLKLLPNFQINYLSDKKGVVMTRSAEIEVFDEELEENVVEHYAVEVGAKIFDNWQEYEDLSGFLAGEYQGYNYDFDGNGVYVDVGGDTAERHYFEMKNGVIFDFYIKVPGKYFGRHEKGFEDFMKEVDLL